jgi:eukaryotic-like serine/threonine-protein kinase
MGQVAANATELMLQGAQSKRAEIHRKPRMWRSVASGCRRLSVQGEVLAGRYQLMEYLGSGGMGRVWEAWDATLGRVVAVKLLAPLPGDGAAAERFQREAHAAARLTAPGIAAVYDFGRASGGRLFLVMELVRGQSLAAMLSTQGPLAPTRVAELGGQAARALAVAHAGGVVHRDVKPGNLLIAEDGTLKVVDFGIAKVTDDVTEGLTSAGLGTPSYTSPEQGMGQPVGPAADLYALGCVLYEALAGHPPFTADNAVGLIFQHVNAEPTPLRQVRADVPWHLEQIVHGLLDKDPATRMGDGAEVARRLDAAASGGTRPSPTTMPLLQQATSQSRAATSTARWARRKRILLPVTGVLIFLTAITATYALSSGDGDDIAGSAPTPSMAPTQSAAEAETPSATPTVTTTESAAPDARVTPVEEAADDPQALISALTQTISTGSVSMESGVDDLLDRVQEIDEQLGEGELEEAAKKVRELREKLTEAQRDGEWNGDPQVQRLVNRLATALPADEDD